MRIIYLTDIHDAFKNLEQVMRMTNADLYLIAGDLLYTLFPSYDKAWKFIELQEYFQKYKKDHAHEGTLYKIAKSFIHRENHDTDDRFDKAVAYVMLSDDAKKRMRKKYETIACVLSKFQGKQMALIPGNYDMDLNFTALREWNLHLKSMEIDSLKISGYGGAGVATPGVPDHLSVPFNESRETGELVSEPYDFFKKEKPDILLIHHPPYGFMDTLPRHGNIGSIGIRNFIDESPPRIVFCGHIHEAWGCRYHQGTFFLNPSNFGRFVEVSRVKKGGYFFDLIIENKAFQVATLRKLEGNHILDLADYTFTEGELKKLILDEYHINKLTSQTQRESHIRSVSRFRRVKKFFLGHETDESKHMIGELRTIYRDMKKQGMNVAFDLLGSLNFGIANPGSDIDLIVYLRGEKCKPDQNDSCTIPRPLQTVFDELQKHHIEIEVCDSLDRDRVKAAIFSGDLNDGHLQRFAFYRATCRPINLRLIKEVENLLLQRPMLRKKLEADVKEYIRIIVSTTRHLDSFKKYQSRLIEKGIRMPDEIADLLKKYLKET
ncbi:MAG: metallophosphoesterase [Deltaproteobacteria bacterium]|nr:metallophosphoesterase [Deltaproteobacteria bacterium]